MASGFLWAILLTCVDIGSCCCRLLPICCRWRGKMLFTKLILAVLLLGPKDDQVELSILTNERSPGDACEYFADPKNADAVLDGLNHIPLIVERPGVVVVMFKVAYCEQYQEA